MAAEVLRRAVQDDVGAVLKWAEEDRRGGGRIDEHGRAVAGRRLHVRKGEKGIRGRFEPDQIGLLGRRAGLVELDEEHAPGLELAKEDAGPVVAALRERDRLAGREQAEHGRGRRGRPGGEEQRVAAFELAER